MIRMISGFTAYGGKLYDAKSGEIALPDDAEARLVAQGVAAYVETPFANAPAAPRGEACAETGVNPPGGENAAQGVQTPVSGGGGGTVNSSPTGERIAAAASQPRNDEPDEAGEAPAPGECIDVADGHMTEESLLTLTRADLVRLAEELGLEVGRRDTKRDLAAKIASVNVEPGKTEGAPLITAALPG